MDFPDPVIGVAVEPKTQADVDKLSMALSKLAEEDPTFQVKIDPDSGQTIINGMGELHLEILIDRLRREFKVELSGCPLIIAAIPSRRMRLSSINSNRILLIKSLVQKRRAYRQAD